MPLGLPSLNQPAVATDGRFAQAWVAFFSRLAGRPGPITTTTPSASPSIITARDNGTMIVSGGAGVVVSLLRGRVQIPVPGGVVPVSEGDALIMIYTVAPTVSFVPRNA